MKAKYKYVSNIDYLGLPGDYLTIGNVYEFEMEDDYYGVTSDNHGKEVRELFLSPSHGKWEKVE